MTLNNQFPFLCYQFSYPTISLKTIEDSLSQLSLLPEMSCAFVSDIEIILKNMTHWLSRAILGEHSRMRSIVSSTLIGADQQNQQSTISSGHLFFYNTITKMNSMTNIVDGGTRSDCGGNDGENQLYRLLSTKIHLFDQFACAIRKLLNFFKIAKVS